MRDITLEETVYFNFTTRSFSTGVPTVLGGTPALSVIESNNATPITSGVSVSVDRASVVGLNQATVVATAANGYEAGKSYSVYISTGTVGGVSVVGEVVAQFTVQSAAAFTRLGAPAGASVSVDVAAIKAETVTILSDTNDIQTRLPAALTANGNMKTESLYENGAVWFDTAGSAGTTNYVHGTVTNTNSSMANSRTIANSLNLKTFQIANASTVTLDQGYTGFTFQGFKWNLALASRAINNCYFHGATVTGLSTGTGSKFEFCDIGTCTVSDMYFTSCGLTGVVTIGTSGSYVLDGCYNNSAAGTAAVIDFGAAVGATTIGLRGWNGALEVRNMLAGDILSIYGSGSLTIAASCTAGTVEIAGAIRLVNSGSGQTITDTSRYSEDQNVANVTGTVATVTTLTNLPAITANWLTAAGTAADFTTEIQTGLATPTNITAGTITTVLGNVVGSVGSVTSAVTLTSGERTSVADALLDRNVSGGSSTGRTVKQALHVLRNKTTIAAGTLTVYDIDDSTTSFTAAVTTTAGDPISSIDPA